MNSINRKRKFTSYERGLAYAFRAIGLSEIRKEITQHLISRAERDAGPEREIAKPAEG